MFGAPRWGISSFVLLTWVPELYWWFSTWCRKERDCLKLSCTLGINICRLVLEIFSRHSSLAKKRCQEKETIDHCSEVRYPEQQHFEKVVLCLASTGTGTADLGSWLEAPLWWQSCSERARLPSKCDPVQPDDRGGGDGPCFVWLGKHKWHKWQMLLKKTFLAIWHKGKTRLILSLLESQHFRTRPHILASLRWLFRLIFLHNFPALSSWTKERIFFWVREKLSLMLLLGFSGAS